jgi:hypothetical protein
MVTSMQRQTKGAPGKLHATVKRLFPLCVPVACAALLSLPGVTVAHAQQPQFPQGFQRPDRGPLDPAEAAAYSAAVNEADPNARVAAMQQFLLNFPNGNMRQAAISQMMLAKRQAQNIQPQPPAAEEQTVPPSPVASPDPDVPQAAPAATPDSLLQRPPKPAEVTITAHSLAVKADNSTLSQILQSIASSTGMKIDGLSAGQDQRIFGNYGPGDPHEVLLSLLDGSGYNVIMVGNTATGTPRELSLSQRATSNAVAASNAGRPNGTEDDGDDAEDVQQAPPPEPPQPAFQQPPPAPGENPQQQLRSPQEILQELQRLRQQGQQPGQAPPNQ